MSRIASESELYTITHKKRPSAQLRWFRTNGIEARLRGDGTVLVFWEAIEIKMGCVPEQDKRKKATSPNWEAMRAAQKAS